MDCLPIYLSTKWFSVWPRIFTKILKPLYENLRKRGFISVYYLDDSWLCGCTYEECQENVNKTSEILTRAGFLVNESKSMKTPSQEIEFL